MATIERGQQFLHGTYCPSLVYLQTDFLIISSWRRETIRLLANGGSKTNGRKVTVGVQSFLSAKHEYKNVETFLYLTNTSGQVINPSNIYFDTNTAGNTQYGSRYEEDIFDIDTEQLARFKLNGHFVTNGNYVEGKWKTTFKMSAISKSKQADCSIISGNMKINSASVSPLGVTLLGSGRSNGSADSIDVSVVMLDGSIRELDSSATYSNNEKIIMKYMSDLPLEIDNVREVCINGNIVEYN